MFPLQLSGSWGVPVNLPCDQTSTPSVWSDYGTRCHLLSSSQTRPSHAETVMINIIVNKTLHIPTTCDLLYSHGYYIISNQLDITHHCYHSSSSFGMNYNCLLLLKNVLDYLLLVIIVPRCSLSPFIIYGRAIWHSMSSHICRESQMSKSGGNYWGLLKKFKKHHFGHVYDEEFI